MATGKLVRNGLPFSNVAATGVATSQITPGRTLENFQLVLGGTALTPAMIDMIRIKANAKAIVEITGAQLVKLNAFRGETQNAAYLDVQFAEKRGYDEFDRLVGALDTTGILSLTSEVSIVGATAPTLRSVLHESAPQQSAQGVAAPFAGVMHKVLRYPISAAAGGKQIIQLPFGPINGALIKRLHIESAQATGVTIKQDSNIIHESVKADNDYENARWGLVNQTNWYSVDFVRDGVMTKGWDTRDARSVELIIDLSAATSGWVIAEYLDTLGNL